MKDALGFLSLIAGAVVAGLAWTQSGWAWLLFFVGVALMAVPVHQQTTRLMPRLTATSASQPSRSDARRLADEARDHATRAAALGLPTGEWTDLAAFWTTWADREDEDSTATAADTPVEHPKPPKGGGGVGNAARLYEAKCTACSYTHTSPDHDRAVNGVELHRQRAHASSAPDVKLPRVQASSPPCAAVEFFVVPNASPPGVPRGSQKRLKLTVPPTSGGRGRRDTVVRDSDGKVQLRVGWGAQPDDEPLAQLRIPANCSTITQSMIYPACPNGMIHTRMMKGAPATEHGVPCDCHVSLTDYSDEIDALKRELHERS